MLFKNKFMVLDAIGYCDVDDSNVALLHRLNDNSYIVVRGLVVTGEEGQWSHAIQYDMDKSEGMKLFAETLKKYVE